MRSRVWLGLRITFAAVGLVFIGLALRDALRDPDLAVLPSPTALAVAVVVVVVGMWAAVAGWARLLGVDSPRTVARGFLVAQLGKYVPGGVWQVVGQVGHATQTTTSDSRGATLAYLASVVTQVAAGLLVGLPVVVDQAVPWWIRVAVAVAAAVAVFLLVDHRLLQRTLLALPWVGSDISEDEAMPSRAALLYSTGAGVVAMAAAGVVFAISYSAPTGELDLSVVPAFALAWTIGFLALPFPAGLGVRETALILLIPDGSSTALVAASAVLRVIYIVGELVAILTSGLAGSPSAQTPADEPLGAPPTDSGDGTVEG